MAGVFRRWIYRLLKYSISLEDSEEKKSLLPRTEPQSQCKETPEVLRGLFGSPATIATSAYQSPGSFGLHEIAVNLPQALPSGFSTEQSTQSPSYAILQDQQQQSHHQTQFTLTVGNRPDHCNACKKARAEQAFGARLLGLMSPLRCSKCQSEHAAVFFSETQRAASESTRACIGHEGYWSVCPHLRISYADIMRWMGDFHTESDHVRISCPEPSCLYHNATIKYEFEGLDDDIAIRWSAYLDPDTKGTFWDRSSSKLQSIYSAFPAAFCPHVQTTPNRLANLDLWLVDKHLPSGREIYCPACKALIMFNAKAEDAQEPDTTQHDPLDVPEPPIDYYSFCVMNRGDAAALSWIEKLNPESYGHFRDQSTKHITWCNDRRCATTYELLQCSVFRGTASCSVETGVRLDAKLTLKMLDKETGWQMEFIGL